jgi:chromosome segregation ATPase
MKYVEVSELENALRRSEVMERDKQGRLAESVKHLASLKGMVHKQNDRIESLRNQLTQQEREKADQTREATQMRVTFIEKYEKLKYEKEALRQELAQTRLGHEERLRERSDLQGEVRRFQEEVRQWMTAAQETTRQSEQLESERKLKREEHLETRRELEGALAHIDRLKREIIEWEAKTTRIKQAKAAIGEKLKACQHVIFEYECKVLHLEEAFEEHKRQEHLLK